VTVDLLEAAGHPGGMISGVEFAGMLVDAAADAIAATPEALTTQLLALGIDLPVVRPQGAPQQLIQGESVQLRLPTSVAASLLPSRLPASRP
jgi:protoporphyrinogen oxidase